MTKYVSTDDIGTLEDLNAKPGDVFQLVESEASATIGDVCTITEDGRAQIDGRTAFYVPSHDKRYGRKWRAISRA